MRRKKTSAFTKGTKERVFKKILKTYKEDPDWLQCFFSEVFKELNEKTKKQGRQVRVKYPFHSIEQPLIPREEKFHRKKLEDLVNKHKMGDNLNKEEGLEILEHLIDLGIKNTENYEEAIKVASNVLKIDFNKEITKTFAYRNEDVGKRVTLLLGVVVYLTWDGKILRIEFKKSEIKIRKKAMSFVGIGEDDESSVSIHHDRYFNEIIK